MTTDSTTEKAQRVGSHAVRGNHDTLTSVLGVSALALLAAAAFLWNPGKAGAQGMVSKTGMYTTLTAKAGNEEILYVLDGRSEELFLYRTDQQKGTVLLTRVSVPGSFMDAKARAGAKR